MDLETILDFGLNDRFDVEQAMLWPFYVAF